MKRRIHNGSLAGDLARLPSLDRAALIAQWRTACGTEPPDNISRTLLLQAVAYRMQERALGGLKPATRRYLERVVRDTAVGEMPPPAITSVRPGTRLLREWHGKTYEVIVADNGVLLNGEPIKSLSAAARKITGAKWSGPLFFGLKVGNREKAA